jgi:hypothetical protein
MNYIYCLEVKKSGEFFYTRFHFSTLEKAIKGWHEIEADYKFEGIGIIELDKIDEYYEDYLTLEEARDKVKEINSDDE